MRVDAGLAKEVEDGDYDGLVAVIGHFDGRQRSLTEHRQYIRTAQANDRSSEDVRTGDVRPGAHAPRRAARSMDEPEKSGGDSEASRRATPSERSGDHSKEVLVVRREAARVPRALSTNRAA